MKRTDSENSVNNKFQPGNPVSGLDPTLMDPTWLNAVQEEICHVIEASGQNVDSTDDSQLLKAVRALGLKVFSAPGGSTSFNFGAGCGSCVVMLQSVKDFKFPDVTSTTKYGPKNGICFVVPPWADYLSVSENSSITVSQEGGAGTFVVVAGNIMVAVFGSDGRLSNAYRFSIPTFFNKTYAKFGIVHAYYQCKFFSGIIASGSSNFENLGVTGSLGVTGKSTFVGAATFAGGITSTSGNFSGNVSSAGIKEANEALSFEKPVYLNGAVVLREATHYSGGSLVKSSTDLRLDVITYGIPVGAKISIYNSNPASENTSIGITYDTVNSQPAKLYIPGGHIREFVLISGTPGSYVWAPIAGIQS